MTYLVQIIAAVFSAIGFSLLFNIHGRKLIITAVGGAITWGVYLIVFTQTENVFLACFVATMAIMAFAEIMARIAKTPVIILLVPMLVPMVPGGDLYRMMTNLVMDNSGQVRFYGHQLVMEVGAIAFGIIVISTAMQLILKMHAHITEQRRARH
ncbi:MAG: threonine/serine exporter family protein [Lachnospiraceae bacterium]|nr:threonine/serine exporter family protein [Lachnospiraceae bacterium]MBP5651843.1 threonine/serine exporter family protein [Lachnospiraceae bacterium]